MIPVKVLDLLKWISQFGYESLYHQSHFPWFKNHVYAIGPQNSFTLLFWHAESNKLLYFDYG